MRLDYNGKPAGFASPGLSQAVAKRAPREGR